jgi:hypothetical protein
MTPKAEPNKFHLLYSGIAAVQGCGNMLLEMDANQDNRPVNQLSIIFRNALASFPSFRDGWMGHLYRTLDIIPFPEIKIINLTCDHLHL